MRLKRYMAVLLGSLLSIEAPVFAAGPSLCTPGSHTRVSHSLYSIQTLTLALGFFNHPLLASPVKTPQFHRAFSENKPLNDKFHMKALVKWFVDLAVLIYKFFQQFFQKTQSRSPVITPEKQEESLSPELTPAFPMNEFREKMKIDHLWPERMALHMNKEIRDEIQKTALKKSFEIPTKPSNIILFDLQNPAPVRIEAFIAAIGMLLLSLASPETFSFMFDLTQSPTPRWTALVLASAGLAAGYWLAGYVMPTVNTWIHEQFHAWFAGPSAHFMAGAGNGVAYFNEIRNPVRKAWTILAGPTSELLLIPLTVMVLQSHWIPIENMPLLMVFPSMIIAQLLIFGSAIAVSGYFHNFVTPYWKSLISMKEGIPASHLDGAQYVQTIAAFSILKRYLFAAMIVPVSSIGIAVWLPTLTTTFLSGRPEYRELMSLFVNLGIWGATYIVSASLLARYGILKPIQHILHSRRALRSAA